MKASRHSRTTMQGVADALELSRLTVSLVINGQARQRGISVNTIQRVQKHLKQCGYVRSQHAMALRTGKSNAVGIIHCGQLFSHLTEAFNLMIDQFSSRAAGQEIMVVKREYLIKGLRELVSRGIERLVWFHTRVPQVEFIDEDELFGLLSHISTIIYNYNFDSGDIDNRLETQGIHRVGVSRKRAYEKLAGFLKSFGHQTVAIPGVPPNPPLDRQILAAFQASGINPITPPCSNPCANSPMEYGAALAADVIAAMKSHPITAVCFRDDELAGHAMQAFIRQGVRIPENLTITGFDGLRIAGAFAVPLTTLSLPVAKMVQCVRELLIKKTKNLRHCFEVDLIQRQSHGKANRR